MRDDRCGINGSSTDADVHIILAFLNIQTQLRDHDVDDDEAVVCRGLVETPFDIETPGFTSIYTLAAA